MLSRFISTSAVVGACLSTLPVMAQSQVDVSSKAYAVAAGDLAQVLHQVLQDSQLTLVIDDALVQGKRSAGVQGVISPKQALQQALQGTGLQLQEMPSGALTLVAAPPVSTPASGHSQQLPAVQVLGTIPSATTQGANSYTTPYVSIGKSLASLRETPYSVSVVTRTQLDEQNAATLGDAMSYVTGIRVLSTTTGVVNLRSRGFRLNNYLLDGQSLRGGQGMWGSALMDTALYDRVEVWRGPAAMLEGAGEPSGTINLARKRAQADAATQINAQWGSWNKRRMEVDINQPLNAEGTARARLVGAWDDRDSFVDAVTQNTRTLYGTLAYDFTADTTLTLGHTVQRGRSVGFAGLPLIAGGVTPDYPRSRFTGSRNGLKRDRGHSSFLELEHRGQQGSTWRTQLSEYRTSNTLDRFISNSMVNPITREFDMEGAWQKSLQLNRGIDSYYVQPFSWGGRLQELTVGASYQLFEGGQIQRRYQTWRQSIDAPDLELSLPAMDLGAVPRPQSRDRSLYANVRLRPHDQWLVLLGTRLAWWDSSTPGNPLQDQAINAKAVPNVGIVYDFHPEWSAYASYNKIFSPQTERGLGGDFLSPRTGKQFEVGVKAQLLEQRVNTHLAVFRIDDHGRAMDDPDHEGYSLAAGHVRSQGFEAEISGQVTPRWNLLAGYAYTQTKHKAGELAAVGTPFDSTFPRHQFSLWTRYQLPEQWLTGAYIGGGMRTSGTTYADYSGVRWQQGGFSVFSLQAGYSWKSGWSATLSINNLFDKHYFERFAGGTARQTNYGEPRSFNLAVTSRF